MKTTDDHSANHVHNGLQGEKTTTENNAACINSNNTTTASAAQEDDPSNKKRASEDHLTTNGSNKKMGTGAGTTPPPLLSYGLKKVIVDMMGGSSVMPEVKVIAEKILYSSDVHNNRLRIRLGQCIEQNFLTADEDEKACAGMQCPLIDTKLKIWSGVYLRKCAPIHSVSYEIAGKWIDVVKENKLNVGDTLRVSCFRDAGQKLVLVINRLDDLKLSDDPELEANLNKAMEEVKANPALQKELKKELGKDLADRKLEKLLKKERERKHLADQGLRKS